MRMAPGSNVDEWDKQHTSLRFVKGCNEKWARLCSCACLPLWNSGSLMSLPVSTLMSFVKDNYRLLDERVSLCGPLVDGASLTFPVNFGWPVPDAELKSGGYKNQWCSGCSLFSPTYSTWKKDPRCALCTLLILIHQQLSLAQKGMNKRGRNRESDGGTKWKRIEVAANPCSI